MAEPDKRQMGDGADNYAEGAKQMANAAKQAGQQRIARVGGKIYHHIVQYRRHDHD